MRSNLRAKRFKEMHSESNQGARLERSLKENNLKGIIISRI